MFVEHEKQAREKQELGKLLETTNNICFVFINIETEIKTNTHTNT